MTLRFRRAAKLRAMSRGIESSHELAGSEQTQVLRALGEAICILDPPLCVAVVSDWSGCREPAPQGSLYCNLHRGVLC